jgi:glycerol uptake facilitator-like aquaporin
LASVAQHKFTGQREFLSVNISFGFGLAIAIVIVGKVSGNLFI